VYNTIAIEELGKPAVAVTNQTYLADGGSAASSKGMPTVRLARDTIHVEDWIDEATDPARIEAGIAPVLDAVIAALTKPLTAEERSPKKKALEKTSRIAFDGDLNEVNLFFYRRGWGDGLPIMPPTQEAVAEMLTGTDLPADYVITTFGPRFGKATVEKIAINAVMAGALPTYMPLLIAGVQALVEKVTRFDTMQDSQGSWIPFWIVNGPVRNDIRLNTGVGALSPGDMPNAAIGRAMGLIIKNIGGIRKGIEDAGALGNPGKYTMVLGENEEESPWDPLHVEHGFKNEESTVTLFFPNLVNWMTPFGVGAKGIMDPLANAVRGSGLMSIVIPPGGARLIAKEGFTKQQVKEYIAQHATVPFSRSMQYRRQLQSGTPMTMDPQTPVKVLEGTDGMLVLVAGGPGGMSIMSGARIVPWQIFVTKKLDLPANWDKLVAKYRQVAPTYAKY
jgi:hypothetical protein